MPWTQKQMLRDANGDLIPQYWDVVEQEFKPLTGSDGANDVRVTESIVVLASRFIDVTVSAGSSIDLLSGINLIEQGFTKIRVAVRTGATELTLRQRWVTGATTVRQTHSALPTGPNGNEFEFNVLSDNLSLSVINSSSSVDGVIIRAIVLGVK